MSGKSNKNTQKLAFREFYKSKCSLIVIWENCKDWQSISEETELSKISEYFLSL